MSYILDALRKAETERSRDDVPGLNTLHHQEGLDDDLVQGSQRRSWMWVAGGLALGLVATAVFLWLPSRSSDGLGDGGAGMRRGPWGGAMPPAAGPGEGAAGDPGNPGMGSHPPAPAPAPAYSSGHDAPADLDRAPAQSLTQASGRPPEPWAGANWATGERAKPQGSLAAPAASQAPPSLELHPPLHVRSVAPPPDAVAMGSAPAPGSSVSPLAPQHLPLTSASAALSGVPAPLASAGVHAPPQVRPGAASGDASLLNMSYAQMPDGFHAALPQWVVGGAMNSDVPGNRMLFLNGNLYHEGDSPAAGVTLQEIQTHAAVWLYRGQRYRIAF